MRGVEPLVLRLREKNGIVVDVAGNATSADAKEKRPCRQCRTWARLLREDLCDLCSEISCAKRVWGRDWFRALRSDVLMRLEKHEEFGDMDTTARKDLEHVRSVIRAWAIEMPPSIDIEREAIQGEGE